MTVWQVAHFIGGCVSLVKLTQERLTGNITEDYKYYFQAALVSKVVQQSYDAEGRTTMDVDNAIAVDEWDDPSVYSPEHMIVLAQIVQICTLKRDYVNIGYYAERFRPVA